MSRDIHIHATGLVSSLGFGTERNMDSLWHGDVGVSVMGMFPASQFRQIHTYEIRGFADRNSGRAGTWLSRALEEAVGPLRHAIPWERTIAIVGTGLRELPTWEGARLAGESLHESDLDFEKAVHRTLGVAIPVVTISNACSAGLGGLACAIDILESGEADVAIVAGTDSITRSMLGLVDRTNPNPPDKLVPFDRDHRGVLMGEGAAVVVVSMSPTMDGKPSRAKILSVATNCDAHHETAPSNEGISRCMEIAWSQAGLGPSQIGGVFAHGTGTDLNDRTEGAVLAEAFAGGGTKVVSTKGAMGHTSGASGLVSLIAAVEALHRGSMPPQAGFSCPLDEAMELSIDAGTQVLSRRALQVDAFGFGGVNAVAIVAGREPVR